MPITIRDSRPSDVPAICAIYGESVRNGVASFEIEPPDEAEIARRRDGILAGGFPYIVAEDDGKIVGYSYAGPYRPRPAYRFTVENSVYVAPNQLRKGIGRALLPALIASCETAGFRLMVAVIGDSANHASIALHAAFGFQHAGLLPSVGWKHGQWLDSVLMTRQLGPGATTPPDR